MRGLDIFTEHGMITFKINEPISGRQFVELLKNTSLGARRPLDDSARIAAMLAYANLVVTAWDAASLIGVARCVTDFAYCCYLSDLAVRESHQKQGVGIALIDKVKSALHPACKIILLAAPDAAGYYPHIGFSQHMSAWVKA